MRMHILSIICIVIPIGHLQQYKSIQPNVEQQNQYWPSQIHTAQGTYYGGVRKMRVKPCGRRQNSQPGEIAEQWIPTFNSRITRPFENNNNVVLKSQSLKIDDFNTESNINPGVTNDNDFLSSRRSNDFRINEARNDVSVVEVSDDCDHKIDQRKSINVFSPNNNEPEVSSSSSKTDEDNHESEIKQEYIKRLIKCVIDGNKIPTIENSYRESRRFIMDIDDRSNENQNDHVLEPNITEAFHQSQFVKKFSQNYNPNNNLPNLNNQEESDTIFEKYENHMDVTNPDEKVTDQRNVLKLEEIANQLMDPSKGIGISDIYESRAMLLESPRVCYACSTASNPACWAPDKRTTVKYCNKNHDACVTKTFRTKTLVLIRDCGKSCDDTDLPEVEPKFKTCSICHSDLCNSAYTVNSKSLHYFILFIFLIKYTI